MLFVVMKLGFDKKYSIISVDLQPRTPKYFQVEKCDAGNLNFSSDSFDIIISFHVVAHVINKKEMFNEIKRVLKKDGIIIHIVPTPWWSFITNFWHYILMPKNLFSYSIQKNMKNENDENIESNSNFSKKSKKVINYIFLHPIGTNYSFIHEWYYFSSYAWKKLFKKNGFQMIKVESCKTYFSGYSVFKMRFLKTRKALGKVFPSSQCFILKIK